MRAVHPKRGAPLPDILKKQIKKAREKNNFERLCLYGEHYITVFSFVNTFFEIYFWYFVVKAIDKKR